MDNKELISQCLTLHKENKSKSFILDFIKNNTNSNESHLYVSSCYLYNAEYYQESLLTMLILINSYNQIDTNLFCYNICQLLIKDNHKALEQFSNLPKSIHNTFSKENIKYLKKSVNDYILRSIYRSEKIDLKVIDKIQYLLSDNTVSMLRNGTIKISNPSKFILNEVEKENTFPQNIIQCYYNESCSGIGDFFRGCCFLFDHISEPSGSKLFIDFHYHDIGHYIKSLQFEHKTIEYKKLIKDVEKINKDIAPNIDYLNNIKINLINCIKDSTEDLYICSNYSDVVHMNSTDFTNYRISEKCKSFMKSNINFTSDIEEKFEDIIRKDLASSYEVIHFRCGDMKLLRNSRLSQKNINTKKYNISNKECWEKILNIKLQTKHKIIVLADSNELKEYVKKMCKKTKNYNILITNTSSQHCSNNPGKVNSLKINTKEKIKNMFYVALDLKFITRAEKIHSFSVYPWGSGFCFWPAKIYDIPFSSHLIGQQ